MRKLGICVLSAAALFLLMEGLHRLGVTSHGAAWLAEFVADIAPPLAAVIAALTLHECAHGYAALLLGDTTARDTGRLTLNPLPHIDPVGLALPLTMVAAGLPPVIGWARAMPVSYENLRNPQRDTGLVALAGPAANLVVVAVGGIILHIIGVGDPPSMLVSLIWAFLVINLMLAVFNLLPLYPMDGARMLASLAPARVFEWLCRNERRAAIVMFCLFLIGPAAGSIVGLDLNGPMASAFNAATTVITGTHPEVWDRSPLFASADDGPGAVPIAQSASIAGH